MNCLAARHRAFAALCALNFVLAASASGCSDSDASVDRDTRDSGARQEDAGSDGGPAGPFEGTCGGERCPRSRIQAVGCCTHAGAGMPGHRLENTGRAPDLCGSEIGMVFPALAGICIQLDQPGEIDSECPAQQQLGGGVIMAGCCTDEGYCGSLETVAGFGCFYATGAKGRPCNDDSDADAGR
jgi:hypothetical protein